MPSIPQSLLWISLVVLWLFVLVPMLISKRDAVRRTSDVALATRVLNGGAGSRLLRRKRSGRGSSQRPRLEAAGRATETTLDEDGPRRGRGRSTPTTTTPTSCGRTHPVVMKVAVPEQTEPDYLDVDVVEDSGALPAGASAARTEPVLEADETDTGRGRPARLSASTTTGTNTSRTRPVWSPKTTTTLRGRGRAARRTGRLAAAPVRREDRRCGQRPQVHVPQARADGDGGRLGRLGHGRVRSDADRLVGVRHCHRRDGALPGVPAPADPDRGEGASPPDAADGAGATRRGERRTTATTTWSRRGCGARARWSWRSTTRTRSSSTWTTRCRCGPTAGPGTCREPSAQ